MRWGAASTRRRGGPRLRRRPGAEARPGPRADRHDRKPGHRRPAGAHDVRPTPRQPCSLHRLGGLGSSSNSPTTEHGGARWGTGGSTCSLSDASPRPSRTTRERRGRQFPGGCLEPPVHPLPPARLVVMRPYPACAPASRGRRPGAAHAHRKSNGGLPPATHGPRIAANASVVVVGAP